MLKNIPPFIQKIKGIYPPYLIILLLFPYLLGIMIDHHLVDFRYLIINLIWLPLFTLPNYWIRKGWYFRGIVIAVFLAGLVQSIHWILIKGPLTVTSLLVVSNTNYNETIDFLNLKSSFLLLLLIPYAYFGFKAFTQIPDFRNLRPNPVLISILLGISGIFILENAFHDRLVRKGIPEIAKVGFSFYNQLKLYKEAAQEVKPKWVEARASEKYEKQTLVLIIGESCSRRHMSLYGYQRNTNPKLAQRNDLYVFNNVVSPYSNTLDAILTGLSNSNLDFRQTPNDETDILDVFHSAGFKTFWISNQSPIGIWDNQVTVLANQSDVVRFVNLSGNSSFETTYTTSWDDKVIAPFLSAIKDTTSKKLIIVHLMGSHSNYNKRYPKEFDVFNTDTGKKERIISEYDNSVLYNDFIVDSLINITAENNSHSLTSLIYYSDHGENVYDEGDNVGHDFTKSLPKVNVEIPLLLWISPYFHENESDRVEAIKLNTGKPYVTDDLFHSLLDVSGIQTPFLDPSRSLFSKQLNVGRRRILEDGQDYDLK